MHTFTLSVTLFLSCHTHYPIINFYANNNQDIITCHWITSQ